MKTIKLGAMGALAIRAPQPVMVLVDLTIIVLGGLNAMIIMILYHVLKKMNIGNYYINKLQIAMAAILLLGLVITVYLVQTKQIFKSRASNTNQSFLVIQNTSPQQPAECNGNTCTTKTLDITIKPNLEGEPTEPIPAKVTLPKSNTKIDPSLGYYIPFKDPAVRVADPEAVIRRIRNSWPNAKIGNWDKIVSQSIANGWNPAFVLTLWMEESGAEGAANYDDALGCGYHSNIDASLTCLFESPNFKNLAAGEFADFMCLYSASGSKAPCNFGDSIYFKDSIRSIYSELVPSGYGAVVR